MAELVDEPPVRRELGLLGRLDGLEGGRPAGRGVPVLLRGAKKGSAQPVVVLRLRLQAADGVLLRLEGHGARPPMLSDPLPARDAIAAQDRGQEHGASPPPREPASFRTQTDAPPVVRWLRPAWPPPREMAPARLRLPREGTSAPATGPTKLPAPGIQASGGARGAVCSPWTRSGASVRSCGPWRSPWTAKRRGCSGRWRRKTATLKVMQ